ncbi:hypothetical protein Cob_v002174 [Colletotrichum orbiculare MAFF 240422]|uniref:Peroxin 20 n=1 Tax=Colletotrichum orbiculare (strain 104-T / ATCC 96160 / CBS 514.97 / LARS 414 / MAFF 240422) TaxID=1213857 RepID=A0A484G4K7_COLOR|nr:hypothetical protein Cob_v002174 [Colletotrichum orbiculare MAFF 240422]
MGDTSCSGSSPFKSLVEHSARDRSLHQDRVSSLPNHQHGFRSVTAASTTQAHEAFGSFLTSNGLTATSGSIGHSGAAHSVAAAAEAEFGFEMDQWIAAHEDRHIEDLETIMEELARDLERKRLSPPESRDSQEPNMDSCAVDNREDAALEAGDQFEQQDMEAVATLFQDTAANSPSVGHEEATVLSVVGKPAGRMRTETDGVLASGNLAHDQSELSVAARQILESVQHEQGEKWKNSQFLLLMRDFKDGNKDVFENEVRDTRSVGRERAAANN